MCGIVGIVGEAGASTVSDRLVAGLKRLEYRGYDSSGLAVLNDHQLKRVRAEGKIAALEAKLADFPTNSPSIDGPVGIAHTRWATHGAPNEGNAHPHVAGRVAVVHNGIIENFLDLRAELSHREFRSQTDTEAVAHLIDENLSQGMEPRDAFSAALKRLRGAYALGVIIDGHAGEIFAARAGSPLAIGLGEGETYLGSDALALADLTNRLVYLEEGDWAVLRPGGVEVFTRDDEAVERPLTVITGGPAMAEKGNFRHFMLKEIYQQPETITRTLINYLDEYAQVADAPKELDFTRYNRLFLVACGTASFAADVAKYWFEQYARLPVEVDIASEFRYREPVLEPGTLFMAVSQSGETADTLAALRFAAEAGLDTAALVNVTTSTMAREASITLPINAGPEIGVASTKAFTCQLTALAALALAAGRARGVLDAAREKELAQALISLPRQVTEALERDREIEAVAQDITGARSVFYLGRGALTPIAFEGALKLKEISYIHAEGYAAGELKHGPIALIEEGTPVVVIAPHDALFEKTVSNLQEVASRGAKIVLVSDSAGCAHASSMSDWSVCLPDAHPFTAPIVQTVAVQLLAYHAAVHLGTDVDQPRNLAKSVTVE